MRSKTVWRGIVLAALLTAVSIGAVSAGAAPGHAKVTWPNASQEIAKSGVFNLPFCGSKPIKLAILDGFGINAWSQESYAAARSEAAKCSNVTQIVSAGGGDLQTMISDIDFGQAELPAIQQATQAGVKVVPWGADAGGKNGTDFVTYVDWNDAYAGTLWAQWMVQALHGKGNVIYTGGPAGNPVGAQQLAAVVKVFKSHPGMHLLTGNKSWPVTNWDPATAQKVTAALLSKYPKIDGIISNYGTDALASVRALQAAGRKLVPVTTLDANGLSCLYKKAGVPLSTISSRNWLGRVAARKAIAAAEGLPNNEPSKYNLPFFEDSLNGKPLRCNPSAPADFYPSNALSLATIAKYGKP
ncbi:MAG: substrate-binding domain-containing protein [Actinobacteria bacterium]|nr:MAG: substrate-binding domain-containing protein [Actinomycetota bacterium]